MTKAIKNTTLLLGALFILWLTFSYIEIITKCINNPVYSNYNLIVILFKHFNNILIGGIF